MHEMGLVNAIIRQIEDVGRENQLTAVTKVTVHLGEVSSVLPQYLTDYWQWAVKKSRLLGGAELVFKTVPAVTLCNACRQTYPTVQHGRQCPHCESDDTVLLTGNEFIIQEVEAC